MLNKIVNSKLSQVCNYPYSNSITFQSIQATYSSIILCFPQIKPESKAKAPVGSKPEEYTARGVPAEWIEPLQALGYTTVEKVKEVEKPGKLANDLNGYKKKKKLDLPRVVGEWIKA